MAYNRLNSLDVKGRVSSSTQGMVLGSMTIMPEPSQREYGLVVMYLGDTGDGWIKNHLYKCVSAGNGYEWRDVTPVAEPIYEPSMVLGTNVQGKVHTTDISEAELECLANIESNIQEQIDSLSSELAEVEDGKVDKVEGKQLSEEDFTAREKEKLSSIAFGAQVNNIEEIQINNITVAPQDKIVNLSILEGHSYFVGDLTEGVGFEVRHDLIRPIFSVQVRDGNGKVVKGTLTADNVVATIVPEENAQDCTMYLICGGI